ncbi:hypothetical protein [Sorangium sp. So ce1078]
MDAPPNGFDWMRALNENASARIQACADIATLDSWIGNVLEAKTAAEVLS